MREGRKKEASKVKQTTRQSNTAQVHVHVRIPHPRQLIFPWKSDCLGCAVLQCIFVCLTLLATSFYSVFLSSFLLHLTNMYNIQNVYSLCLDGYTGDVYILVKLLLPTSGKKRVYNLQSKQIVKLLSQVLCWGGRKVAS